MICPKCGTNIKRKEGMVCSGCKYKFVLDPKMGAQLSDRAWLMLFEKATAGFTLYITVNQLYMTYCARYFKKALRDRLLGNSILLAIGIGLSLVHYGFAFLFAALIGLVFLMTNKGKAPSLEIFKSSIKPQLLQQRKQEYLIQQLSLNKPPDDNDPREVFDYGVERLLIVERDILVDMLVLNGWHAETKTMVLSESGYPQYLRPVAMKILEEQPDMPVFLLHDASGKGEKMSARVKAQNRIPLEGRRIVDLGLNRSDVERIKRLKRLSPAFAGEIPVDFLAYGSLVMAIGAAMNHGVVFAELLDPNHPITGSYGSDFG